MPDIQQIFLFAAASAVLAITPGPDILYVVTRGMTQGRKAALSAAAGFSLGNIAHTTFAVLGLSAIVMSSVAIFTVIKLLGAAYLIYIGWKTFTAKGAALNGSDTKVLSPKSIFIQSITANMLNPKVALFFIAFLPQFVRAENGSAAAQMAVFGLIFILCTFAVFSFCGLLAGFIGDYLKRHESAGTLMNRIAGVILMTLGLSLALYKKA
ncbi:LysE family translocator [Geovibrio thiophilus]|uniref:LysE family translocator n=1 Tax=Geovibrio thiophilus TaxID=139438 RepID=A0A410K0K6_9BACT|nr:LysE family translocator [Geovibrio thiophilus]QAR33932.1 LysE family translocator [Geovibrio thiophilus]